MERDGISIYEKLQEYLGIREDSISILEENIDTDIQLEYFQHSRNLNSFKTEEEIIRDKDIIFDMQLPIDEKKSALIELASLNNVEAYRTIEKYLHQPNIKLYKWACMALQESKLKLESNLLDESKALISTGLGGKGLKLRYFIVLFTPDGEKLSQYNAQTIRKELNFYLPRCGAELEDILFEKSFASILAIIPLKVDLQELFRKIIKECNDLGDFLYDDFIITNMKAMSVDEITELLCINNIY